MKGILGYWVFLTDIKLNTFLTKGLLSKLDKQ